MLTASLKKERKRETERQGERGEREKNSFQILSDFLFNLYKKILKLFCIKKKTFIDPNKIFKEFLHVYLYVTSRQNKKEKNRKKKQKKNFLGQFYF